MKKKIRSWTTTQLCGASSDGAQDPDCDLSRPGRLRVEIVRRMRPAVRPRHPHAGARHRGHR